MGVVVVAGAGAALGGCTADAPVEERTGAASAAVQELSWEAMTVAWGAGPRELGLRPAAKDFPAEGPSSVAVGPSGAVVILDRLNDRVVEITPSGDVLSQVKVARDAEHVAVGPDGAIAAWSPLRATVWIAAKDGTPLGEVAVPRVLRDVQRIDLGISHMVYAISAMQEMRVLGSPRAPLDLAAVLRSGKEGAAFLADGRGVAARVTEGGAEIVVYRKAKKGDDRKPPVAWTFPIEAPVAAVRVVGATGNVVCARLEKVTQPPAGRAQPFPPPAAGPPIQQDHDPARLSEDSEWAIVVEREALCVEADTGHVLARRPMGRAGLYTMHADVAVGGSPPVLAIAKAEQDGLHLERVSLAAKTTEVAR